MADPTPSIWARLSKEVISLLSGVSSVAALLLFTAVAATALYIKAKAHARYLAGGRAPGVLCERLYRFEFPERPGALGYFLRALADAYVKDILAQPPLTGHAMQTALRACEMSMTYLLRAVAPPARVAPRSPSSPAPAAPAATAGM
eukprot:COSAG01_NODE_6139_length_3828_cov_90.237597_2_plen_146_part_00